jgi:hypothetical protein
MTLLLLLYAPVNWANWAAPAYGGSPSSLPQTRKLRHWVPVASLDQSQKSEGTGSHTRC